MRMCNCSRLIAWIAAIALFACAGVAHARGRMDQEHAVKAALIYKFLPFIDWPSLGATGSPFVIGVYGADEYEHTIEDTFAGKSIGGHPIVVQQLHSDAEIAGCRILFSGASSETRIDRLANICIRNNVLLVGDATDFAKNGGTLGFVLIDSQVRFKINLDTAKRSGVKISSRLVQLATDKYGEGGP